VALESLIILFLGHLFPNCEILGRGLFRLIRDSDVEIEEEAEDPPAADDNRRVLAVLAWLDGQG
jgi:polyphosphate kinase